MELVATLGLDVRGPDGNPVPVQAGEVVVFYFSAHWCPPCRQFTPLLAKVHTSAQNALGLPDARYTTTPPQPLHVIFVSGDKSEAEMISYMKESHGKWSYVSFGTPGSDALNQHFNVQGIPAIHVCAPSGVTAPVDARNDIMRAGADNDEAAVATLVQRWRAAAGVRPDMLPCGVKVELVGLKQEELNGQVCEVVGADLASERVRVRLSDGRVVAIRRASCAQQAFGSDLTFESLELKPCEEGYIVGDKQVPASDVIPGLGTVVRIEGLQSKPEKNGSWGTIRAFDPKAGRVEVEVSAIEVLKLRPNNIRI